jgi:uncharacterized protein with PIN domain
MGYCSLDKPETIYCSNPRCKREILEPLVITDFSTSSKRTYTGCPDCFSEINLVVSQIQEVEPETIPTKNEENKSSQCNRYYAYLESRTEGKPIPEACLVCPKLLDCALKT